MIATSFHCTDLNNGDTEPCDHSDGRRYAILGAHNLDDDTDIQNIPIIKVESPPGRYYQPDVQDSHDFAIAVLKEPAKLNNKGNKGIVYSKLYIHSSVLPICLPKANEWKVAGKTAYAAGWGMTGFEERNPSLQFVKLIVSKKKYLAHKMFGTNIYNSRGEYTDPCQGDSGKHHLKYIKFHCFKEVHS